MRILALDPATVTGFAYVDQYLAIPSIGCRVFRSKPGEHPGLRFAHYREFLNEIISHYEPNNIVYEEPLFPGKRTRRGNLTVSFGFEAQLLGIAAIWKIPCHGVHPGTLKKWATGNGKATKEQMIEAARTHWPTVQLKDHQDNEADALMLLNWALTHLGVEKGEAE